MQRGPALLVLDIDVCVSEFSQHFSVEEVRCACDDSADEFGAAVGVGGVAVGDVGPECADGRLFGESLWICDEVLQSQRGVSEFEGCDAEFVVEAGVGDLAAENDACARDGDGRPTQPFRWVGVRRELMILIVVVPRGMSFIRYLDTTRAEGRVNTVPAPLGGKVEC